MPAYKVVRFASIKKAAPHGFPQTAAPEHHRWHDLSVARQRADYTWMLRSTNFMVPPVQSSVVAASMKIPSAVIGGVVPA